MQPSQDPALPAQQLERHEGYLAADPDNPQLRATVIDLCLAVGQPERAALHARAGLDARPGDPFFESRLGNALLAQHEWEAAATLFGRLLTRFQDAGLAFNFAYACWWLGRHQQGWEALAPHVAQEAVGAAAGTLAIRLLHQLGELDRATAFAGAHMEECGGDAGFLGTASAAWLDAGNLEVAERLAGAALERGRTMEALVVGGSVALARTDHATADVLFAEALERNPQEGRAWSGLGLSSLLRQDIPAAIEQLEQAVRYLPGHIGSWHVLGWARIFNQDLAGAEAAFRTALDLDRNFGESHGGLAVVYALAARREEAQAAIERAMGLDRQSLSARYAQMVLAGELVDQERFRALAMRILSAREGAFGRSLGELVQGFRK